MNKFLSLALACLLLSAGTYAQQAFNPPKDMAPFQAQLTDGTILSKANIKYDKPVVLIYFSPECEHCQALTKELITKMNELSKARIYMISFVPLASVKNFETQYKLNTYQNVKLGTEGVTFTIRYYYHLQQTPFVGVFDRKGVMVKGYNNNPPMDELIKLVNAAAAPDKKKK